MGVRGAGHRFMPNRLVFPGGAVDPVDRSSIAASEPRPDVMALLQRSARPPLARAIAAAAARELFEETGLTLGAPPHLHDLDYLCRAVTPPQSPVRFNARFLIVAAEAVSGQARDSDELQNVRFYPLQDMLQENLVLVTREVLARLEAWLALHRPARRKRDRIDVFRERRWGTE